MTNNLHERMTLEDGTLIHEGPYLFRRLYKPGQDIVMNRQTYFVVSCVKDGSQIKTILRKPNQP